MLKENTPRINDKRKLFFCPIWQCDRLDSYLSAMEKNGLRLSSASWLGVLHFQESVPKTVQYFCTYTCLKDRSMSGIEDELRSIHRASPIPTKIGSLHIHRITETATDLTKLEELRWGSLSRVMLERLFFSTVFMVGIICVLVRTHLSIPVWLALAGLMLVLVYYSIGFVIVKKKTISKNAP